MGCRSSRLSERVYAEANRLAPGRNKDGDGTCPSDAHHATNPDSDHEPRNGVSQAVDLTHDPANGFDVHHQLRIVARNIVHGLERRVKYIISKREIFEPGTGRWRPFRGNNPHDGHGHVSWMPGVEDDTSPFLADKVTPPPAPDPILAGWDSVTRKTLKPRDPRRWLVLQCARRLRKPLGLNFYQSRGYRYSQPMRRAVQRYQRKVGLPPTGNIGPRTYAAMYGLTEEAG